MLGIKQSRLDLSCYVVINIFVVLNSLKNVSCVFIYIKENLRLAFMHPMCAQGMNCSSWDFCQKMRLKLLGVMFHCCWWGFMLLNLPWIKYLFCWVPQEKACFFVTIFSWKWMRILAQTFWLSVYSTMINSHHTCMWYIAVCYKW